MVFGGDMKSILKHFETVLWQIADLIPSPSFEPYINT